MSWILTATGRAVDMAMPMPANVDILDIACALAQLPRFTGHCARPYSVAEHSLLVTEICERELQIDAEGLLAALLHDAAEAYMGDCNTPLKVLLGNAWYAIERRHEGAIALAFDLRITLGARQAIKQADLIALATERRDLMPSHAAGQQPWDCLRGVHACSWVNLAHPDLAQHSWLFWRDRFLDRFGDLMHGRQLRREGCSRHDVGAAA
jgi:hypothetical protein